MFLALSVPAAAGLLLWARRAGDIDREPHGRRSAAAAGECGQCHGVSVRRKLTTDFCGPAVSLVCPLTLTVRTATRLLPEFGPCL